MHAEAFVLDGDTPGTETVSSHRERDPRIDPQPGDVLACGSDAREVWERIDGRVEYGFPGRTATRWFSLIQWQRWARNADVKKVAL